MYNKNAAYDLSLFEEKKRKKNVVRLNTNKLRRTRELKAKITLMIESVIVCVGIGVGVATFITGQAKISELTEQSNYVSKQLQEKESLYTQLEMRKKAEILEEGLSSQAGDLGMTKSKNIEYINIVNSDKAELKIKNKGIKQIKSQILRLCNNLFSI